MRLRPHTHAALLRQLHRFCKKNETPHNAQMTAARQRSSGTSVAQQPAFRQKPQNFSGEVVQPLTSGCILLPAVTKCKRVARFFLQIFYIVPVEETADGAQDA